MTITLVCGCQSILYKILRLINLRQEAHIKCLYLLSNIFGPMSSSSWEEAVRIEWHIGISFDWLTIATFTNGVLRLWWSPLIGPHFCISLSFKIDYRSGRSVAAFNLTQIQALVPDNLSDPKRCFCFVVNQLSVHLILNQSLHN